MSRTAEEVLASISHILYPEELGGKRLTVKSVGADGDTPLHVVAWRKDIEGARLLLAAGADVNAKGDMSETPLHVAIRQKSIELTKMFLAAGADPNIRGEFGKTPKEAAKIEGGAIAKLF